MGRYILHEVFRVDEEHFIGNSGIEVALQLQDDVNNVDRIETWFFSQAAPQAQAP
jgi:hypothetical protein